MHPARGSPPRMRGKVTHLSEVSVDEGITPAYAGKSFCGMAVPFPFGDHPRVCGEKLNFAPATFLLRGSPPRMRGKEVKTLLNFNRVGITPACAGKSDYSSGDYLSQEDHPRVCGEKPASPMMKPAPPGSPPRMRGKVHGLLQVALCVGITPACAGKSLRIPRCATRWREHPRACGEKYFSLQVRRSVLYSF